MVAIKFISMTPKSLIFNSFFQGRKGGVRAIPAILRDKTAGEFSCQGGSECGLAMGRTGVGHSPLPTSVSQKLAKLFGWDFDIDATGW